VQITAAETEGIGTRAGYYDSAGVIRDMIQNHLLQLLCMTAMEPPVAYDGVSLRDETTKVLRSIRPTDVRGDWVVGQYGRSMDGKMAAYRKEANVPADSRTPTYAAVRLYLDSWRWAGVPFYLRSGKRLSSKVTTICIHFKPTPHLMFAVDGAALRSNVLTFRVQPDEGIVYNFLAKQPGPGICLQPVKMTFRYDTAFGIKQPPSAYQWLLHDAMHGDQTLFARSDWIYEAWSVVDAAIRYWENNKETPLYAAGTWGPDQAEQLLAKDGRSWQCIP
jgi:glucose-6-phosphate 1-dehydrogenase